MKHVISTLKNSQITDTTPVVLSARGQVLGRISTQAADILRGKDSVHFAKHLLSGRPVVITHAKEVIVTGNKMDNKIYYSHSGYIGNMKQESLRQRMERKPSEVLRHAISGMLPDNRLRKHWLAQLEIRDED
jgi:large subunit ribosomal protein L13